MFNNTWKMLFQNLRIMYDIIWYIYVPQPKWSPNRETWNQGLCHCVNIQRTPCECGNIPQNACIAIATEFYWDFFNIKILYKFNIDFGHDENTSQRHCASPNGSSLCFLLKMSFHCFLFIFVTCLIYGAAGFCVYWCWCYFVCYRHAYEIYNASKTRFELWSKCELTFAHIYLCNLYFTI